MDVNEAVSAVKAAEKARAELKASHAAAWQAMVDRQKAELADAIDKELGTLVQEHDDALVKLAAKHKAERKTLRDQHASARRDVAGRHYLALHQTHKDQRVALGQQQGEALQVASVAVMKARAVARKVAGDAAIATASVPAQVKAMADGE